MNSALLLANSAFSSLDVGRISMFKGCEIDLTTILRSLTTFVKAIIVLLLAVPVSGHSFETKFAREVKINAFRLQLANLQLAKI